LNHHRAFSFYLLLSLPAACMLPTAWGSVWEALLLVCFLATPARFKRFATVCQRREVYLLLLLYISLLASALWQSHWPNYLQGLEAYKHLLLFPVLLTMLSYVNETEPLAVSAKDRLLGLLVIAASAVALYLLAKYLSSARFREPAGWMSFTRATTTGVMCVFAAYALLWLPNWRRSIKLLVLTLLAFAVLFILPSRTSFLCCVGLAALAGYHACQAMPSKRLLIIATGLALVSTALITSPNGLARFQDALTAVTHQEAPPSTLAQHSASERKRLLDITRTGIEAHPLLGQGLGSFTVAVNSALGTHMRYTHAHNQFLHLWFEAGLAAVLLLLLWLQSLYRAASHRPLMLGLLLLFCIGCLFNSFLVGASEARFFMGLFAWLTFIKPKS
jgi:O-antigen ligase